MNDNKIVEAIRYGYAAKVRAGIDANYCLIITNDVDQRKVTNKATKTLNKCEFEKENFISYD